MDINTPTDKFGGIKEREVVYHIREQYSIYDIFRGIVDSQFNVPIYQRTYSWDVDQVTQLFRDVCAISQNNMPHYMGPLVIVSQQRKPGVHIHYQDVIDGQQRLTAITLFAIAIIDYALSKNDNMLIDKLKDEFKILIYNVLLAPRTGPEKREPELALFHRNADGEEYQNLVLNIVEKFQGKSGKGRDVSTQSRAFISYKQFKNNLSDIELLSKYFTNDEGVLMNDEEILRLLCNHITKDLKFSMVMIPEEVPARFKERVFETLNTRGRDLTQMDLVNAWICMGLEEEKKYKLSSGMMMDRNELHKEYWDKGIIGELRGAFRESKGDKGNLNKMLDAMYNDFLVTVVTSYGNRWVRKKGNLAYYELTTFWNNFVNNGNSTHVLGIDGNGMSPVSDIKRIGENTDIDENFVSFLLLLKHDAKLYAEYIMPEI